jgi:predicted transposase/invertase (TIGR01784 family)
MAIEIAKEEAFEDGIAKGIEKGIEKGVEKGTLLLIERMLMKGKSIESIAYDTDISIEQITEINERLMSAV